MHQPTILMNEIELLHQVRACRLCSAHLPLGPRPVLQWTPRARILIAGQAPGRKVHESGIPFADASGDRLRAWTGLTIEQFHNPELVAILPMGFCYPGTGASGDLPPRPECAPAWRNALLAPMTNLHLTLVIGQYAQAFHYPESARSLTELVAAWREFWPQTIPLPHPSPRNNMWLRRNPWFETDILPTLRGRILDIMAT